MSELIKHECGIALVRLLKPLEYYQHKYGTWMYGLNKLFLLMEKQHNRGQDGAGVAMLKLNPKPGNKYIFRERSIENSPINAVFNTIFDSFSKYKNNPDRLNDTIWAKENIPFAGEIYLGHLRYGTFGNNTKDSVHPVMRQNNWKSKNLVLAGNFNLTNVESLFNVLVELGQHPKDFSDTVTILENIGHFLDTENQRVFGEYKNKGFSNKEISDYIADNINIQKVLSDSSKKWDGGYVISGLIGHGDAFVTRDPWGIRPAFYYHDEEIAVVTSERSVIQTAFNVPFNEIKPLDPGHAFIIRKNGQITIEEVRKPQEKKSCSFERIYFSRGNDASIYKERKKLGELVTPDILKSVNYDLDNTVFSFIPNTAESAFYGMLETVEKYLVNYKKEKILTHTDTLSEKELERILSKKFRFEKIAIKDAKLRTFITQDDARDNLVDHVYDITYGTLQKQKDTLVIIDDSIVRGTTLKKSIIKILDRLEPKKIIIVSSSPQIRYPDCYGIDMAKLGDFIAFRAAIELLKESGENSIINSVYKKSKEQLNLPANKIVNYVKEIYQPFTDVEISTKIAQLVKDKSVKASVEIIYQSVENLHKACPTDKGDWYFTGNYPTPGGNKVVNTSFINFIEGKNVRAY